MKGFQQTERRIERSNHYPGLFAMRLSETREIVAIGMPEAEVVVRERVAEIMEKSDE